MKIAGLSELLESLKEEVEGWELAKLPPEQDSPEASELLKRGLYLTAMDIVYAEMKHPGGYESYARLPDRVLLPETEYREFRANLMPYILWLKSLLLKYVAAAPTISDTTTEAFPELPPDGLAELDKVFADIKAL
ncbi:MAG: hypothetical protein HY074_02240 [Deltaproteobacteria bacterium]|nr:hypothetical protein [Deltaproteobacteria bacterium]